MDLPSPFSNSKLSKIDFLVYSAALSGNNEILLLKNALQHISLYNIDTYNEICRIFIRSEDCQRFWYIKSHDAILLLDHDEGNHSYQFRLFLNWRPTNPSMPNRVDVVLAPSSDIKPNKWHFPLPQQNKFQSFLLNVFNESESPTCEIYNSSIAIITRSSIIIWDLIDRPILRTIILLPLPVQSMKPLHSFRGDRLAIVTKGVLFIIKILETSQQMTVTPFTTGTNCLKLEENKIFIDFGLSQERRNILFIERHLPERSIAIQINFQLTVPGEPKSIGFLSDKLILLITADVVLGCVRKITKNGREIYDPARLCNANKMVNVLYNTNFVIFYNHERIEIIPNPEKSNIDFSNGIVESISGTNLKNISFLNVDENRIIAVTSDFDQKSTLYILDFEDINVLSQKVLSVQSVEAKMIGIRLLDHSSDKFAETAYEIAFELLKANRKAEAVPFFVEAFNYGSREKRAAILAEISGFEMRLKKQRLMFVEGAEFREEEITDLILKDILSLEQRTAAVKLIQAHKFESNIQFSDSTEGVLFQAIIESLYENHQTAKNLFLRIDESLIATLDDVILSKISKDLKAAVLVRLGKPQFNNDEWSLNERRASYSYMNKLAREAIEFAANSDEDDNDHWHFSAWPVVPKLCKWIKGHEKMQFIAGCVSDFNIPNRANGNLSKLIAGINLAKNGQFKAAIETFSEEIYPINFLRDFAKSTADWVEIIQQITDDEEIHQAASHFLISNSPKNEFYTAIESIKNSPEFSKTLSKLKEDDVALIELLSVEQ